VAAATAMPSANPTTIDLCTFISINSYCFPVSYHHSSDLAITIINNEITVF
jgi:hypothetical protein